MSAPVAPPAPIAPVSLAPHARAGLIRGLRYIRWAQRDALGLARHFVAQHGDFVRLPVPGQRYIIANAEAAHRVLQDNHRNYGRGDRYQYLEMFLGKGLLTNDGESWLAQRRLIQPAFHKARLAGLLTGMDNVIRHQLDQYPAAQTRETEWAGEMMRVTLGIAGHTLLGTPITHDSSQQVADDLNFLMHYAIRLIRMPVTLPRYLPMPGTREANRRIRQMDALMMGIVAARRALLPENRPNDLLTMLLEATDADTGQTMDNRQLRDEVTTLFVAGHETTANGMAWLGWLLAENPEIQQQLQAEVDAVGDAPLADMATLQRLELTGRVVDEGLRLYPPAWILGRRSLGPDTLAGYDITANSFLIVMPGLLHRNPKYWPRPERFDPDRFLPEVVATRPKGSYIPFGAGPRFCIGNQFALLEMKLLVARYMQRYRFETLRAPNGHEALVTLRPKSGIRLRMVAR